MKRFPLLALLALAWLPTFASAAQEAAAEGQPVAREQEALIAPTVIAQHQFALHLAPALGVRLAQSNDPMRAVRALMAARIEPRGGWDPDGAMTPKALAEVRQAVAEAADNYRLKPDRNDAVRAFDEIVAQLELPRPAGSRYAEAPANRYEGGCDAAALDYYYGPGGIPPYTYCRPPAAYFSFYAWVPSSFYWGPYYFPGYYALQPPYVIVYPPRPPRFSEGIIGGRQPTPAPPPTTGSGGFRDTHAIRPAVPRAVPIPPGSSPRFSGGIVGGRQTPAPGSMVPSAPATPTRPSTGVVPRAPTPMPGPPIGAPSAPSAPPSAPAPSGGGRGWGDVFGR